jgi:hypothetical protein
MDRQQLRTCVSALAWSISVFASAVSPLMAQPMCSSISATFSMLLGSCSMRRKTYEAVAAICSAYPTTLLPLLTGGNHLHIKQHPSNLPNCRPPAASCKLLPGLCTTLSLSAVTLTAAKTRMWQLLSKSVQELPQQYEWPHQQG